MLSRSLIRIFFPGLADGTPGEAGGGEIDFDVECVFSLAPGQILEPCTHADIRPTRAEHQPGAGCHLIPSGREPGEAAASPQPAGLTCEAVMPPG